MIAALLAALAGAATADEPLVVDRVPLIPRANLSFHDDILRLHPYLVLGAGVGNDPRGGTSQGERWGEARVGAALRWYPSPGERFAADLQTHGRLGSGALADGDRLGRLQVEGRREAETGWLETAAQAGRERLFIPALGGSVQRDDAEARVRAGRIGRVGDAEAALGVGRQRFDGIGADRDRIVGDAELRAVWRAGDARWGARLRGDAVSYRSEGRYSSSQGLAAWGRGEFGVGASSALATELGLLTRQYRTGSGPRTVAVPGATLTATTERPGGSTASLIAATALEDNVVGNAEVFSSLAAALRLPVAPSWHLAINARAGHGRDTGRPTGQAVERRVQLDARVGLEYHLPGDGSALRLEGSAERYRARRAGDWEGARLELAYFTAW